jgi:hypothetical protein
MSSMSDQMRRRIMWTALILLVILASIESSLALMRDMLIADKAAMLHDLSTMPTAASDSLLTHIPMVGQMVMGFVLPFVLAFVAIPLEVVVYSLRTVIGVVLVMLLRSVSFALRFIGLLFNHLGRILSNVYDIFIVLPLLIERWIASLRGSSPNKANGLKTRSAS